MSERQEDSRASSLRAALLVLEGYAYLLAIVALFVGMCAFLVWGIYERKPLVGLAAIVGGVPVVMLASALVRALVFRVPEVEGIELTSSAAPQLFELVEELRRRVGAPRVHRVVIGPTLQASAIQSPRLGFFRPRNTLLIGYPLLVLFSDKQLRAVVAHELAHLGRAHGRVAHWIYRTQLSWRRLIGVLTERQAVPIFVYWLARVYIPRLERHSAGIGREQERFADRCAADAAGSRAAAEALVASELGARVLRESFWPAAVDVRQTDLPRPYTRMRSELRLVDDDASTDALAEILGDVTHATDSHPALAERLAALGERAAIPVTSAPGAGEELLGEQMHALASRLDAEWQHAHGDAWRTKSNSDHDQRARLASLEAQTSLSAAEMFERATLLEALDGPDAALPVYQAALEADQRHAGAALAAGRILLERDDDSGAVLVERAVEADETLLPDAAELLVSFHRAHRRLVEAERWRRRAGKQAVLARIHEVTPS